MCGIAGIISSHPLRQEQVDLVGRINAGLVHRGPDGEGHFRDQHVALAMRRLSIIDLATGWQPLYNENKTLALICNGEIYNFVELRKDLEQRGHRFATHSDCETILHLYEEHGDDCVNHLRGMFAFALWDSRRRRLLIGRDRLGEKPLYLVESGETIIFASELKALVGAGVVALELDPSAINLYFHYSYVPEPFAPLKGVRKLPAAHTLGISFNGTGKLQVEQQRYWRMEDAPELSGNPATLIREELEQIAELIVRSDVPVGVALSSGLDSSAIACLAHRKFPGTMHAISIGYEGTPWQDERGGARALAAHLGMPFHEIELSTSTMVELLRTMPFDRDDPMADMSGVNYYAVMRRARELNVPVMLSGHGGDELFWGYPWVRQAVGATERKHALQHGASISRRDYLHLRKPPFSYTSGVRWLMGLGGMREGWRQYDRDRSSPVDQMVFYNLEPQFQSAVWHSARYYGEAMRGNGNSLTDPHALFTMGQPWLRPDLAITRLICDTYLMENGLAQGDRLSMASSIELRSPMVDYRLVETVIGLRKAHPDHHLPPKHWLRAAIGDVVPAFVLQKRKRGFTTPWRQWTRIISEEFGSQLEGGCLVEQRILSAEGAQALRRRIAPPPLMLPSHLPMCALMLELWCRGMSTSAGSTRSNSLARDAGTREPAPGLSCPT